MWHFVRGMRYQEVADKTNFLGQMRHETDTIGPSCAGQKTENLGVISYGVAAR